MADTPWPSITKTYHHNSYPAISPTHPEVSAAGKTILITGGGRGLGATMVDAFAAAGAAHIIITGRNAATLWDVAASTEAAHPSAKVTIVAGDVSREESVAAAFEEAKKVSPGGVDVVVANAGHFPVVDPHAATGDSASVAEWWRAWEVNVKGLFLLAKHFLESARPGAVFVNISSGVAHLQPSLPGFSAYAGAKLGAAKVIETMQAENPGFRFYNVQPGVVETDMFVKSTFDNNGKPWRATDARKFSFQAAVAVSCIGQYS